MQMIVIEQPTPAHADAMTIARPTTFSRRRLVQAQATHPHAPKQTTLQLLIFNVSSQLALCQSCAKRSQKVAAGASLVANKIHGTTSDNLDATNSSPCPIAMTRHTQYTYHTNNFHCCHTALMLLVKRSNHAACGCCLPYPSLLHDVFIHASSLSVAAVHDVFPVSSSSLHESRLTSLLK